MWLSIIIGLLVLSVIIVVHELGHFIAAKASDVKVEEFALGFPPKLFSFKKGETVYSLNAIPFGGFTKMLGEEDPTEPRSFASKKPGTRLLILSAGPLMNILLAILLSMVMFAIPHDVVSEPVIIEEVSPGSPAALAGILPADQILEINDREVKSTYDLQRLIQLNLGEEIEITLSRGDELVTTSLVPRWDPPEGEGATGIVLDIEAAMAEREVNRVTENPLRAVPMGLSNLWDTIILYKNSIVGIVTGAVPLDLMGPVGIVQVTGEVATAGGVKALFEFSGFISLIIGVMNILPLPALDGGRIAFVSVEWIRRGKKVSPKVEGMVHLAGFVLLMGLMLIVTYQDIVRIITQGGPLP